MRHYYSKRQSSFYFGVCCAGFWPLQRQISNQNPCASAGGIIVNDKLFLSFTIKISGILRPVMRDRFAEVNFVETDFGETIV